MLQRYTHFSVFDLMFGELKSLENYKEVFSFVFNSLLSICKIAVY